MLNICNIGNNREDDNHHIAQDGGREGDHMSDTVQRIEDD